MYLIVRCRCVTVKEPVAGDYPLTSSTLSDHSKNLVAIMVTFIMITFGEGARVWGGKSILQRCYTCIYYALKKQIEIDVACKILKIHILAVLLTLLK